MRQRFCIIFVPNYKKECRIQREICMQPHKFSMYNRKRKIMRNNCENPTLKEIWETVRPKYKDGSGADQPEMIQRAWHTTSAYLTCWWIILISLFISLFFVPLTILTLWEGRCSNQDQQFFLCEPESACGCSCAAFHFL